ncbi:MAG: hypothetical protein IOD12_02160 [Silvanigrellales bacterium]|jgi:hypothetical protein|nr:hypothetical protein [Silvanigrellales bacterium]
MKRQSTLKFALAVLAYSCVAFVDAGTDARSIEKAPSFVSLLNASSVQRHAVRAALAAHGEVKVAVDEPGLTIFAASLNSADRAAVEALPGVAGASIVWSIIVVKNSADIAQCASEVARTGSRVRESLEAIQLLIVEAVPSEAAAIAKLPCVEEISLDDSHAGTTGIAGATN